MDERQHPTTEAMKVSDVRAQWSQLVNRVFRHEQRILVEKDGIPVAALVSTEDLARLQRLDQEREQDFRALDRIGEVFKDQSAEEIEREVARAVSSARAKRRVQSQSSPLAS